MKLKLVIFLVIATAGSTFFSACTGAASKSSKEVALDSPADGTGDEVFITNADLKTDRQTISTTRSSEQLAKRILSDNSEVEGVVDGFGNKIETRSFPDNGRLQMVILRTSFKGEQEATVYGKNGEAKKVPGLGERALTASAEEIAAEAQLSTTEVSGPAKNFLKKGGGETQSLQPLSSSEFQKPATSVYQTTAPAETSAPSEEKPAAPQGNPEED
ncbi:MAG TPA: hypothetical protein VIL74_19830 [Pyrinomonadaceae bacterium]|jgi:hypothetical protein